MTGHREKRLDLVLDDYRPTNFSLEAVEGLSRRALDLHLDLYRGYVKQVNSLQSQIADLAVESKPSDHDRLRRDGLVRRLAFEFNGMVLHELFFEQLASRSAESGPLPGGVLMRAMDTSFAGPENWRNDVMQLAETRGVGWVVVARQRETNRLINIWVGEHQLGLLTGAQPIAVFDLWEHAYLLDFAPTARYDYLSVLFRNLDWSVLEARCR